MRIFIIGKNKNIKNRFRKFTAFLGHMNLIIDVGNTYVKICCF